MKDELNIAENIRRYRLLHKLTQAQLAELIGKSQSTVYAYENNTIIPPFDVLITISEILEVRVETLMGIEKDLNSRAFAADELRSIYDAYVRLWSEANE